MSRAKLAFCGREECGVSTGIHGGLTFGTGNLDANGFWEFQCVPCTTGNLEREAVEADKLLEAQHNKGGSDG